MKPVDAAAVWAEICFVVPAEFRREGVAAARRQVAIAYADRAGAAASRDARVRGRCCR
jgi:hypothetical protein